MVPKVAKLAIIHFDGGGQSPGPVTAACVVELSDGPYGAYAERFEQGTHNTAEWHALILGLRMALAHGAQHIEAYGDSQLVVDQINDRSRTKHAGLLPLRAEAQELLGQFEHWSIQWIPRAENGRADELGRMMSHLALPVPAPASALDDKQHWPPTCFEEKQGTSPLLLPLRPRL
jgi:ribonuclease HI